MKYCPDCQESFPEGDKFCPDCGRPLEAAPVTEPTPEAAAGQEPEGAAAPAGEEVTQVLPAARAGAQPNLFKNPVFWLIAGGVVLVLAAVGGLLLYLNGRSEPVAQTQTFPSTTPTATTDNSAKKYQDDLTKSWTTLRDITVELVKKDSEVVDQASLNAFTALLTVSSNKVEQTRSEMGAMQVPQSSRQKHQDLIDAIGIYRDYLKSLQSVTGQNPSLVNSASFQPVNTLGEDAQKKVTASQKQLAFLKAWPDECFLLHTSLSPFYEAIWQAPMTPAPGTPTPAPMPAPTGSEQDAILAMVLSDSAGSWAGADNYEVASYDPTTNSAIVLVTYYLPNSIRYSELYCDKDQYGWYVSYENTYEVPY